jgi:hypothetical protein
VAQRVWVPIYKISLAEMIVEYKEKVKENATFFCRDQERPRQGRRFFVAFAYGPKT